MFINLTRIRI